MTWHPTWPGNCAPPPPDRFRLSGASQRPDPRVNAYRKDIADVALAGVLFAPHYAAPALCGVAAATMLHEAPDAMSRAVSQLMPGEVFAVLDATAGWAWGRSEHDGYVGYVPIGALGTGGEQPTHHVVAASAPVFVAPDIKAAVSGYLPVGTKFAATPQDRFLATGAGFVHVRHASLLSIFEHDPVAVAERLIGLPYLWGGRGAGGIDCSGLVQVALGIAGMAVPRDSDMQRDAIGRHLDDDEMLARGDIVFFPGHVGMMVDETNLIHATAHWMAVVVEPLDDVIARLAPDHATPVLARRRPA